jgi:amino acid adenylation domain-containing protein
MYNESILPFSSILELFELNVTQKPNAIALQCGNEALTYTNLNKKANQLAHYLLNEGVTSHHKIALYSYRSIEYMIGLIAVIKTGATFIPIASDQPKERVAFILANSDCKMVLSELILQDNLTDTNVPVLYLNEVIRECISQPIDNLNITLTSNSVAYILYTSGSTGNPKGVIISQSALSNYLLWAKDYYEIDSDSILPLFTSIGFDLTITSKLLPLLSGGKLIIYKENANGLDTSLLQLLEDNIVNVIKLTPSHLVFFKDKNLSASNIRTMIVGGEDFKVQLGKSITSTFGNGIRIFNEYGPTEATVGCIVSEYKMDTHIGISIPIGRPIKNMHVYILDAHKKLVPNGVIGELYLSGESLANGYIKLDELTNAKFVENPFVKGVKMYHTGDLARINEHGEYEYFGRVDEQVKLRGYRIELTDIESNLLEFKGIVNCAVVLTESKKANTKKGDATKCKNCGIPSNNPETELDSDGICRSCHNLIENQERINKVYESEEKLVAYYTGSAAISSKDLREHLSKKLPSYMIPSIFTYLDEIPLTKNGKVDKKTLKNLQIDDLVLETIFVAPRNEFEELIENIWKEVLQLNKIGVHDNFIAIGGHSLAAIRITSAISEELELKIPLNKIFELPSIEGYANYIEQTILELL